MSQNGETVESAVIVNDASVDKGENVEVVSENKIQEINDKAKMVMENDTDKSVSDCNEIEIDSTETKITVNGDTNEKDKAAAVINQTELKKSAYNLLAEGNKKMLLKDYEEAVTLLSQATEMFVKLYGELGDECGPVYYSYGCACLSLAERETPLLGAGGAEPSKKCSGNNDEKSVSAEEEKRQQETGVSSSNCNGRRQKEYEDDDDDDDEDEEGKDDDDVDEEGPGAEENEPEDESLNGDEEEKGEEEEEEEEEDDGEETYKSAWEALECAKTVFSARKEHDKVADCLVKLGEISILIGNYQAAVDDINAVLAIRKEREPPYSRLIAQAYFSLAIAFSLDNKFDKAVENLELSRVALKSRIDHLRIDKNDGRTETTNNENAKEIEEIEGLLKECEVKLVEFNVGKDVITNLKDVWTAELGVAASSTADSSSAVQDISHLVRKKAAKRKTVDGDDQEESAGNIEKANKKLCSSSISDAVNK